MTDADRQRQRPRPGRPALEHLLAGLTAVRGGDFSTRLALTGDPLVDQISTVFNAMAAQLDQFTTEVTRVAREVGTEGKLGGQANMLGVSGTWKDLTESVNAMADNLTSQVRNIAHVTTAVAQGDLTRKIDVDARGEILELKTTINTMVDQLSSFAAEVTRVARQVGREGRLGGQAEVEGVSGTWKQLTENVNELSETLTRQVRAISEVTSAVQTGDLTRSISVEAQGEVAELKDNINAMVVSLREMVQASREQDWLKSNLASIAAMMQGHRDLEVVADLILEELAPLLGAQHGTFFVAEESGGEQRLRLIAGYGLRADKDAPIQYRIGQSLIGQVAKSKRTIVVDNIPEGYIRISSGLGDAPPVNLAVLPILFEGHVHGVVELASFTRFTPIQVDFLEQVTESLGVSVNAIIANSRTDTLLEQSQRLTAELQARSEELQLSNADLEEKAAQLAAQKQDIEVKNAQIERARAEIEERARQLARASRYKSQFLANMSHELRTPLNSLLILARLLAQNQGRNLTAKQVEYARVIHSAGSDLLQLINDILDLSKVEAGRMDVTAEAFPLAAIVEDLRTTFGPLTAEKGLDFTVDIAPSAPAELDTDRQRLRQVLGNLLSNAIKFTERGQVAIRVKPSAETPAVVVFSVTDTGIGIAPENLAAIFGAFQQGDGTLNRRFGGTGLGLSIASEVSSLLGGKITVESDLGRGSTFSLHVPVTLPDLPNAGGADPLLLGVPGAPADGRALSGNGAAAGLAEAAGAAGAAGAADDLRYRGASDATAPSAAPDRHVLVLEGTSGGLLTLLAHSAVSDLTEINGSVRVSSAVSPSQGVAMLAAEPFRCVVVDLRLESAFDFLEQVRTKPELADVPVLAHLAGHPEDNRLADLRSGHQSLELLPSLDELRERITLHLSAPQRGQVPALVTDTATTGGGDSRSRRPGLRGKHILVIDDDSRTVFAITSTLEMHGMRVTRATNGRDGIDVLTASGDVDLILMDVMMPGMDGYATMNAVRQMPRFARLPIIAVTARAMAGDRDKSLAAGASDYVTKPVDTEELLGCMERWIDGS